jgi:segregation and condensation protein A
VGYNVSTSVFEGPFDLLLHLVTREQVDIWELSLSSIVDEFVATIEQMKALDLSVATEFLLTAAVLLELKARKLLPDSGDAENEETLALWEERDLLLARLLECKTFKEASLAMNRLMDSAQRSVPRRVGLEERFVGLAPDPLEGLTAVDLHGALAKLLVPKPVPRVNTEHVAPVRASVADAVDELVTRLPAEGRTTFRRLVDGVTERLRVIVYFLAVLELYKRGSLDLVQTGKLADLHINWLGLDAPDFGEPNPYVPYAYEPNLDDEDAGGPDDGGPDDGGPDDGGPDDGGLDAGGPDAGGPVPGTAAGPVNNQPVNSQADLVSEYEG